MTRVLITGMSATGKSSVIEALRRRGHEAIDTDEGDWHEWAVGDDGTHDRMWREDRMRALLARRPDGILFVSGTAPNQGKFYPRFDHVILLTAPTPVVLERLARRTNNPFGKDPAERARILEDIDTVEPLLRRRATLEIDTSAPLEQVVDTILATVGGAAPEQGPGGAS